MKIKKLLEKQKVFEKLVKIGISINSYSLIDKCQKEISKTLNLKNEDCKYKICRLIREYVDLNFQFLFKDIKVTEYQKEIEKNFIETHKILPMPETMYIFRTIDKQIDKQIEKFLNILK